MSDSRVSFICSPSKLRDLAPLLVGEVDMLHIEPLDMAAEPPRSEPKRLPGLQARDRIEAFIEGHLDRPGFEFSRLELKRILVGFGFKSPSASVSHAMTGLARKYDLEVVGSSLWRIKARRPSLAHTQPSA